MSISGCERTHKVRMDPALIAPIRRHEKKPLESWGLSFGRFPGDQRTELPRSPRQAFFFSPGDSGNPAAPGPGGSTPAFA